MITNKLKELAATRAKVLELEKSIAAQLNKELAALPARYGYASVADFIKAVRAAGGKGGRRTGQKAKAAAGGKKRRSRAVEIAAIQRGD